MKLVFLGAPGAGKGTQAAAVAKEQGWAHIASGDLFHQAVERGDELGQKVKGYIIQGLLVPDAIATKVILDTLQALPPETGFILDGFPRTLNQAQALDKSLPAETPAPDRVVYINISQEELVRRLSGRLTCRNCQAPHHLTITPPKVIGRCDRCGGELYRRPDDTAEAIRQRWQVFLTQTTPLLDYYKRQGKLSQVNGEGVMGEVTKAIKQVLGLEDGHSH